MRTKTTTTGTDTRGGMQDSTFSRRPPETGQHVDAELVLDFSVRVRVHVGKADVLLHRGGGVLLAHLENDPLGLVVLDDEPQKLDACRRSGGQFVRLDQAKYTSGGGSRAAARDAGGRTARTRRQTTARARERGEAEREGVCPEGQRLPLTRHAFPVAALASTQAKGVRETGLCHWS